MSANRNPDGPLVPEGGSGEFHSKVPRDEPLQTSGHQPGKLVGNDTLPEFHAQTLPSGTAPTNQTFAPDPSTTTTAPTSGEPTTTASATLTGATSADVHAGLGHPGAGQSSKELRHDGQSGRKNPGGGGVEGVGGSATQSSIDPHDPARADQRALDDDAAVVGRGGAPAAQERVPEGAETVAAERK